MGKENVTHLIAAGIIEPPYLYSCAIYNISNCAQPGINYELLSTIALLLRFTFEVVEITNVTSHEELIEELGTGNSFNLSATMVTINEDYFDFVQFSHSMMYYRKSFAIKTPKKQEIAFLLPLPFTAWVWLCFFISIPLIALVFTVSAHTGNNEKKKRFSHNLWTVIGGLVKPVNTNRLAKGSTQRFMMFIWNLCKTVMLSLYGASLITILVRFERPPIPFNSSSGITHKLDEPFVKHQVSEFSMEWNPNVELSRLAQLMADGRYRAVEIYARSNQPFIAMSLARNKSYVATIRQAILDYPPKHVTTVEDALQLVAENDNLVFSDYNTNLQVWIELYNICGITIIEDQDESLHHLAFAFPKNFPKIEEFQRATSGMSASLYVEFLLRKYGIHHVNCTRLEQKAEKASGRGRLLNLTVSQLQGTFYLLFCGAAVAIFLFVSEYHYRK